MVYFLFTNLPKMLLFCQPNVERVMLKGIKQYKAVYLMTLMYSYSWLLKYLTQELINAKGRVFENHFGTNPYYAFNYKARQVIRVNIQFVLFTKHLSLCLVKETLCRVRKWEKLVSFTEPNAMWVFNAIFSIRTNEIFTFCTNGQLGWGKGWVPLFLENQAFSGW